MSLYSVLTVAGTVLDLHSVLLAFYAHHVPFYPLAGHHEQENTSSTSIDDQDALARVPAA